MGRPTASGRCAFAGQCCHRSRACVVNECILNFSNSATLQDLEINTGMIYVGLLHLVNGAGVDTCAREWWNEFCRMAAKWDGYSFVV